ncbi:purine-nucleoside phosphorylase [Anoxybacter fermentans]|uniref:Purine nucleoside phosphorylase n=1 Tax=Anoxybacter fermentans TaxID=1323375 RepID=A0A3S9SYQ3_9FIRM|nr:purine-nucleoside phosphorylase [Anoxybacter fermentans]AZR73431.1 purine-nucleoside phosphorylase [Anoxybacter fermentans]
MDVKKIIESVNYIKDKIPFEPEIGMILGSGLGILAEEVENPTIIPYEDIPNFPVSTVQGHAGRLVVGMLEGKRVLIMQGRFHFYEGYSMEEITRPVRSMKLLGIKTLIVTNASGGINENFNVGDLMFIRDHINFMGTNPLIGKNYEEFGPRFPDMTHAYDPELIELGEKVAEKLGISTRKGVYIAVTGPSYETPAEIKAFRRLGADAVGMSTVPEVIVANHMGIRVLGISCITNMAAGVLPQPLDHSEVMETAERTKPKFIKLVRGIVKEV